MFAYEVHVLCTLTPDSTPVLRFRNVFDRFLKLTEYANLKNSKLSKLIRKDNRFSISQLKTFFELRVI